MHGNQNLWTPLDVRNQLWMTASSPRNRRAFGLVDATRRKLSSQRQLLRVGVSDQVSNERELDDH